MALYTAVAAQNALDPRYHIDWGGGIWTARYTFAAPAVAGDDGSTLELSPKLPQGRIRLLPGYCKMWCSAFGAARVLNLGHAAYKDVEGNSVAEALTAIVAAKDISAALNNVNLTDLLPDYDFFSADGVALKGSVTGGTWPTTGTLDFWITFLKR